MADNITMNFELTGVTKAISDVEKLVQVSGELAAPMREAKTAIGGVSEEISAIKEGFDLSSLSSGAASMPDMLQNSINAMAQALSQSAKQMQQAMKVSGGQLTEQLQIAQTYLAVNSRILNNNIQTARALLHDVSPTQRSSFNSSYTTAAQDAANVFRNFANTNGSAMSDRSLELMLRNNKIVSSGVSRMAKNTGAKEDLIYKSLVQTAAAPFMRREVIKDIQRLSGGLIDPTKIQAPKGNFYSRLPEQFRGLSTVITPSTEADISKFVRGNGIKAYKTIEGNKLYNELLNEITGNAHRKGNITLERALNAAGIQTRFKGGSQVGLPTRIDERTLAYVGGFLHRSLNNYLEGAPSYLANMSHLSDDDAERLGAKNGTVAREVDSAFRILAKAGVKDLLYTPNGARLPSVGNPKNTKYIYSKHLAPQGIRPDEFVIPSVTYADFGKGILPTARDGLIRYSDSTNGKTTNKMISRNILTDLLGMQGNLTYGNGSKTNMGTPKLIYVDFGEDAYAKKDNGELDFDETGNVKYNDATKKIITDMFDKSKHSKTIRGSKYSYSVIKGGPNGNTNYVPISTKHGSVILAAEGDYDDPYSYVSMSKRSLDTFGVNVFDAFENMEEVVGANKQRAKKMDTRNRSITPSIPFAEMQGWSIPGRSKTAILSMKDLFKLKDGDSDAVGIEGTGIISPGYIPDAAVIRMPGVKGSLLPVDLKKMVQKVYGNVDSLYAPTVTASDDMKKAWHTGGIDAVVKQFGDSVLSNGQFVDVLKMDMLLSDDLLKSSFYTKGIKDGATHEQLVDRFYKVLEFMDLSGKNNPLQGIRAVQTAAGFQSQKDVLSNQVAQYLNMDFDTASMNQSRWTEHINKLKYNDQYAYDQLFKHEIDKQEDVMAAMLNPDSQIARKRREAIAKAEEDRMYGRLFGENEFMMGMAALNPFDFVKVLAERNGKGQKGLDVVNEEWFNKLGLTGKGGKAGIAAALGGFALASNIAGLRFPNNFGEQFPLLNNKEYIDSLKEFGMSPNAIYMNAATLRKMGTGDFDGDTVQLIKGKYADIIRQTFESNKDLIKWDEYGTRIGRLEEPKDVEENRPVNPEDWAQYLYRQAAARFRLGRISNASGAIGQVSSNDVLRSLYAKGALDLADQYDIDTTWIKTGVAANWSKNANKVKKYLGTPFSSVFKDMIGAVTSGDYSKFGDLSKVNMPSIYNASSIALMEELTRSPLSSNAVDQLLKAQDSIQNLLTPEQMKQGHGTAFERARTEYFRARNKRIANAITGRGFIPSQEDDDALEALYASYRASAYETFRNSKSLGITQDEKDRIGRELRIQEEIHNAYKTFGLSHENVEKGLGYSGYVKNNAGNYVANNAYTQGQLDANPDLDKVNFGTALTMGGTLAEAGIQSTVRERQEAEAAQYARDTLFGTNPRRWSISNLRLYRRNAIDWYNHTVNDADIGNQGFDPFDTALGSAVHSRLESIINARLQKDLALSEPEILKGVERKERKDNGTVENNLIPLLKEAGLKNYFNENGELDFQFHVDDAAKLNKAIEFVKLASSADFLKDEDIVASEFKTTLDLGQYKHGARKGQDIATIGYADLVTYRHDKNHPENSGFIINEFKSHEANDDGREQTGVYGLSIEKLIQAGMINVDKLRAKYGDNFNSRVVGIRTFGYLDENGSPMIIPFGEGTEQRQKAQEQMEAFGKDVSKIEEMAFSKEGLRSAIMAGRQDIVDDVFSFVPKVYKDQLEAEIGSDNSRESLHKARGALLNDETRKQDARTIAEAFSLRKDVDTYIDQLDSMYYELNREGIDAPKVKDKWGLKWSQINSSYDNKLQEFINRGLTSESEEIVSIKRARDRNITAYNSKLLEMAPKDLSDLKDQLNNSLSDIGKSRFVSENEKNKEQLNLIIEEQSSALNQLEKNKGQYAGNEDVYESSLAKARANLEEVKQLRDSLVENSDIHLKINLEGDALRDLKQAQSTLQQFGFNADNEGYAKELVMHNLKNTQISILESLGAKTVDEQANLLKNIKINPDAYKDQLSPDLLKVLNLDEYDYDRYMEFQNQRKELQDTYNRETNEDRQRYFEEDLMHKANNINVGSGTIDQWQISSSRLNDKYNSTRKLYEEVNGLYSQRTDLTPGDVEYLNNLKDSVTEYERQLSVMQDAIGQAQENRDWYKRNITDRQDAQRINDINRGYEKQISQRHQPRFGHGLLGSFGRRLYSMRAERDEREYRVGQLTEQLTEQQAISDRYTELKNKNGYKFSNEDQDKLDAANRSINELNAQITGEQKALEGISGASGVASAAMGALGDAFSRLSSMFGRRIFMKLLSEVTQFMKQYDTAMTNVRMITMKTSEEMDQVGASNFATARRLKTDVVTVAEVKSGLYRQGLSDEEVEDRTDQVIKFAKVAGIKTETASKIMTTALKNGLVDSAQEAMDVLAALGDSAATTADEIQKALQKVAATAHSTGMEYNELTALLTVALDKTQLSGNVIGTAMNTIMTRMRRVNETDYVKASNGEITTINDVDRALSRVGVSIRDENGDMKDTVEILKDLSKVWGTIDTDMTKQNIVYAMAGRGAAATNTLYSVLEALGEDGGEAYEKALQTAMSASGTVDEKYTAYLDSYNASLQELNTSIDTLGNTIVSSGIAQFFVDFAAGLASVPGLIALAIPAIAKIITSIATAMGAMSAAQAGVFGLAAFGVGAIGYGLYNKFIAQPNAENQQRIINDQNYDIARRQKEINNRTTQKNEIENSYENIRNLYKKYGNQTGALEDFMDTKDLELFNKSIANLGDQMGNSFTEKVNSAKDSMQDFYSLFKTITEEVDEEKEKIEFENAEIITKGYKGNKSITQVNTRNGVDWQSEDNIGTATARTIYSAEYWQAVLNEMGMNGTMVTNPYYTSYLGSKDYYGNRYTFTIDGHEYSAYEGSNHTYSLGDEALSREKVIDLLGDVSNKDRTEDMRLAENELLQLYQKKYPNIKINDYAVAEDIGYIMELEKFVNQEGGLGEYLINKGAVKNSAELVEKLYNYENRPVDQFGFKYSNEDIFASEHDKYLQDALIDIAHNLQINGTPSDLTSPLYLMDEDDDAVFKWENGTTASEILSDVKSNPDLYEKYVKTGKLWGSIKYASKNLVYQNTLNDLIDSGYYYGKNSGYAGSKALALDYLRRASDMDEFEASLIDSGAINFVQAYWDSLADTDKGAQVQRLKDANNIDGLISFLTTELQSGSFEEINKLYANAQKQRKYADVFYKMYEQGQLSGANISELGSFVGYDVSGLTDEEVQALAKKAYQQVTMTYTDIGMQYASQMMANAISSKDYEKWAKENKGKTFVDYIAATDNEAVRAIYESARASGYTLDVNAEGTAITSTFAGIPGYEYTNPLINRDLYIPEESRIAAQEYYNMIRGGASQEALKQWLNEDAQRASMISSDWKDLVTWSNLSQEEKDTIYGKNLERRIEINFVTSGLTELETAGEILAGMASSAEKIMSLNKVEAHDAMEQQYGEIRSWQKAEAAYDKLARGERLTSEQWEDIAKGYNIADISEFQRGIRGFNELGSYRNEKNRQIGNGFNETIEGIITSGIGAIIQEGTETTQETVTMKTKTGTKAGGGYIEIVPESMESTGANNITLNTNEFDAVIDATLASMDKTDTEYTELIEAFDRNIEKKTGELNEINGELNSVNDSIVSAIGRAILDTKPTIESPTTLSQVADAFNKWNTASKNRDVDKGKRHAKMSEIEYRMDTNYARLLNAQSDLDFLRDTQTELENERANKEGQIKNLREGMGKGINKIDVEKERERRLNAAEKEYNDSMSKNALAKWITENQKANVRTLVSWKENPNPWASDRIGNITEQLTEAILNAPYSWQSYDKNGNLVGPSDSWMTDEELAFISKYLINGYSLEDIYDSYSTLRVGGNTFWEDLWSGYDGLQDYVSGYVYDNDFESDVEEFKKGYSFDNFQTQLSEYNSRNISDLKTPEEKAEILYSLLGDAYKYGYKAEDILESKREALINNGWIDSYDTTSATLASIAELENQIFVLDEELAANAEEIKTKENEISAYKAADTKYTGEYTDAQETYFEVDNNINKLEEEYNNIKAEYDETEAEKTKFMEDLQVLYSTFNEYVAAAGYDIAFEDLPDDVQQLVSNNTKIMEMFDKKAKLKALRSKIKQYIEIQKERKETIETNKEDALNGLQSKLSRQQSEKQSEKHFAQKQLDWDSGGHAPSFTTNYVEGTNVIQLRQVNRTKSKTKTKVFTPDFIDDNGVRYKKIGNMFYEIDENGDIVDVGLNGEFTQAGLTYEEMYSRRSDITNYMKYLNSLGYYMNNETGRVELDEIRGKTAWSISDAQAARDYMQGAYMYQRNTLSAENLNAAYRTLYEKAQGKGSYDDFLNSLNEEERYALQQIIDTSKEADFFEDINGNRLLSKNVIRNRAYSAGYETNNERFDISNAKVREYIGRLMRGDKTWIDEAEASGYGDQYKSAMQNILGDTYDELYLAATTDNEVSKGLRDAAQKAYEENRINYATRFDEYANEGRELYSSLTSDRASVRRSARQEMIGRAQNIADARWAFGQYESGAIYDDTVMSLLSNATGYTMKQLREKYASGQTNDISAAIDESWNDLTETLKQGVKSMLSTKGIELGDGFENWLDVGAIEEVVGQLPDEIRDYINGVVGLIVDMRESQIGTLEESFAQATEQKNNDRQFLLNLRSAENVRDFVDVSSRSEEDWSRFVSQNPEIAGAILGGMDNESIVSLINSSLYGGSNYQTAMSLLNTMMPGMFSGELTADKMQETYDVMAPEQREVFDSFMNKYSSVGTLMQAIKDPTISFEEALKGVNEEFRNYEYVEKYGEESETVNKTVKDFTKNARTAVQAIGSMTTKIHSLSYQNKQLNDSMGKAGNQLTDEQLNVLSGIYGIDQSVIKGYGADMIDNLVQGAKESLNEQYAHEIVDPLMESVKAEVEGLSDSQKIEFDQMVHVAMKGDGAVDVSELANIAHQLGLDCEAALNALVGTGSAIEARWGSDGNEVWYKIVKSALGTGGTKSGGGGGGGKSKFQKFLTELKNKMAVTDHEIKMIQAQETKYENRGEYGNLNAMIELENEAQGRYIDRMKDAIEQIKEQMKTLKQGSDDWYAARDAIFSYEEAIEQATQAIEDNEKKIKENQQATYKAHTDVEDTVREEARRREEIRRSMLSATVNMEDTILDAIRKRYTDEWDLIQRDLDRKRQALEDEKNLISERLQARKDAEQEAEKYEQLAEYQRQLAYVSMDPTRTKDAAELRQKITDLQKEIAWDTAEKEAQAAQEVIDDQLETYEQYSATGEEQLNAYLEDANNFADEIDEILKGSSKDISDWLSANIEEFRLSLKEQRENMIEGWKDMYKEMYNITDMYHDLVAEKLVNKETFMEYMKLSDDYINATEDMRKQMEYEWETMYDDYIAALKTGATYLHLDDWLTLGGDGKKSGGGGGSDGSGGDTVTSDVLKTIMEKVKESLFGGGKANSYIGGGTNEDRAFAKYASGGLVDYTGPAWVDGSPLRPEAFLNAEDTALMRGFLDAAKYVSVRMSMPSIDDSLFGGTSNSVGDVYITINEAEINSDQDIDKLAERVGDSFVKQLSMQGFHTSNFSF